MTTSDPFDISVETLPAAEFVETFLPDEYGETWDDVEDHPNFWEPNPFNPERVHAGTMRALEDSLRTHGVREPVEVEDGRVVGGHHRVIAARNTGIPIRYTRHDTPEPTAPRTDPTADWPIVGGIRGNPRYYNADGTRR